MASASTSAEAALAQRTEIFILQQVADVLEQAYEGAKEVTCEAVQVGCATFKNIIVPILSLIWFIVFKVSQQVWHV